MKCIDYTGSNYISLKGMIVSIVTKIERGRAQQWSVLQK
jgi:hypothetical protein